jgi:hypothetical protein
MTYAISELEKSIDTVTKSTLDFVKSSRVKSLYYSRPTLNPANKMATRVIQDNMRFFLKRNQQVKSLGIYYSLPDYIITPDNRYSSDEIEEWGKSEYGLAYKDISKSLNEYTLGSYLMLYNDETPKLLFVSSLDVYMLSNPIASVLITIDCVEIVNSIKDFNKTIGSEIYIQTWDDKIFDVNFQIYEKGLIRDIRSTFTPGLNENYDGQHTLIRVDSSRLPWTYFTVIQPEIDVSKLISIFIVCFALSFLVGFLTVLILVYRRICSLSNFKRLVESVSGNKNLSHKYTVLADVVDKAIDDYRKIARKAENEEKIQRDLFLSRFTTFEASLESAVQVLGNYNIRAHNISHVAAIYYTINGTGKHFSSENSSLSLRLLRLSLRNVGDEFIGKSEGGYTCEVGSDVVFVVFGVEADALYNRCLDIANQITDFFKSQLDVNLSYSVSCVFEGISSIPRAYRDCISKEVNSENDQYDSPEAVIISYSARNTLRSLARSSHLFHNNSLYSSLMRSLNVISLLFKSISGL